LYELEGNPPVRIVSHVLGSGPVKAAQANAAESDVGFGVIVNPTGDEKK
jgi:hypothetical protein